MSDEQLARQGRAGSLDAFEELVLRYENRVYAFVVRACRNPEDAAEVTQDTFVKVYQALPQYDPGRPFAPWLFTIARRKCIDRRRARPPEEAAPVPESTELDDPADLLARKEERKGLWECAHRILPEPQFQALWLRYAEEMNVRQIAQVLRKTRTHVKVLLFRARRRLSAGLDVRERVPNSASTSTPAQQSGPMKRASACGPSPKRVHAPVTRENSFVRTL